MSYILVPSKTPRCLYHTMKQRYHQIVKLSHPEFNIYLLIGHVIGKFRTQRTGI